jgi:DNA-binding IclR family transcriptional regulator
MTAGPDRRIHSVENAFDILSIVSENKGATLTDIADEVGLSESTTHTYLETLRHLEFLIKRNGTYELSLKFLHLGGRTRNTYRIYGKSQPELRELYRDTGQMVHLAIEQHDSLVYLERIDPDVDVGLSGHVGQRIGFHAAAPGKAILAHLPAEQVESIVSRYGLPAHTEETITDRTALAEELERVRERGYAVDDEEVFRNHQEIAWPVFVDGAVEGAIGIAGPKTEMETGRDDVVEMLRSAADRIELKLEHD